MTMVNVVVLVIVAVVLVLVEMLFAVVVMAMCERVVDGNSSRSPSRCCG